MYWEAMRTPALPGEYDVTDGSVDYYDTDWENVDNSALEEEMQKCGLTPCEGKTMCPDNTPAQTDLSAYEIVSELREASSAGGGAGFSLLIHQSGKC